MRAYNPIHSTHNTLGSWSVQIHFYLVVSMFLPFHFRVQTEREIHRKILENRCDITEERRKTEKKYPPKQTCMVVSLFSRHQMNQFETDHVSHNFPLGCTLVDWECTCFVCFQVMRVDKFTHNYCCYSTTHKKLNVMLCICDEYRILIKLFTQLCTTIRIVPYHINNWIGVNVSSFRTEWGIPSVFIGWNGM